MRRQSGLTLIETMIALAVSMGVLAGLVGLAASVRADAATHEITTNILSIADAIRAQSEFDGVQQAQAVDAQMLKARVPSLARYVNEAGTHLIFPGGLQVKVDSNELVAGPLNADQCVSAIRAVKESTQGVATFRFIRGGAGLDVSSPALITSACHSYLAPRGGTGNLTIRPLGG